MDITQSAQHGLTDPHVGAGSRLYFHIQRIDGPQQFAFLPCTSIGVGIRALQLLPSLATGQQRSGGPLEAAVILSGRWSLATVRKGATPWTTHPPEDPWLL